jgi:hypothetical protein
VTWPIADGERWIALGKRQHTSDGTVAINRRVAVCLGCFLADFAGEMQRQVLRIGEPFLAIPGDPLGFARRQRPHTLASSQVADFLAVPLCQQVGQLTLAGSLALAALP